MNYLAILLGALSVMVLGAIWFHPKVMGKSWMAGAGVTEEEVNKTSPLIYVGALLMSGIIAWAMSRYAGHTEEGMSQFVHGMYHGSMTALMFVAPVLVSKGLFELKPLSWIITGAIYWIIALTLVGGIVYAVSSLGAA